MKWGIEMHKAHYKEEDEPVLDATIPPPEKTEEDEEEERDLEKEAMERRAKAKAAKKDEL